MNKEIFFPLYFWLLFQTFVEDPLHLCGGFEVFKRKDKRSGFSLNSVTTVANEFFIHLNC